MIALDTNVLVRFLVRDDDAQAKRASALVDRLTEREERAYVSDIVLCELVWVLDRSYRYQRAEIVSAIAALAGGRQLRFDSTDNIRRALAAFASGKGDFSDYLVREHALAADCERVVTFDELLLADSSFSRP